MKRTILAVLLLILATAISIPAGARRVRTLRLSSYNIQHGEGMDKKIDHARIADLLRQAECEVAAIQEVDSVTKRNGGVYALEEIGRHIGMHATYAPAIDFQGGKYGIGILSKKRPLCVHRIALPGREERRMLLVAEFKDYVVACTHLSLTEADRMASVALIVEEARQWKKPFIIMGDLNDEPGSPFYREMEKHFIFLNSPSEMTFPSTGPRICIDHVALFKPTEGATLSFHRTWVGSEESSDHRPLHARIGLSFNKSH
ncbi:MAG: endonuclease/exonuclease/phosphatase family protein [Bacteroidaceae bacterium]|nr:endonuclease/exonuclease/phosphatase family protein [Bacteroidaceae bacterium]